MKEGGLMASEGNSVHREPEARSISRVPIWDNDLEEGLREQVTMCHQEALGGSSEVRQ